MHQWNQTIKRPAGEIQVSYCFNRDQGFSASISSNGKLQVTYHSIADDFIGLSGFLGVLVEYKVFTREQVQEALCAVVLQTSDDYIDEQEIRNLAFIVQDLRQVAAN